MTCLTIEQCHDCDGSTCEFEDDTIGLHRGLVRHCSTCRAPSVWLLAVSLQAPSNAKAVVERTLNTLSGLSNASTSVSLT